MQLASPSKNVTAQGVATLTLDSTQHQQTLSVAHGLGGVPTNVQVAGNASGYIVTWEGLGATNFIIRVRHRADIVNAISVLVYWQASKEG